MIPRRSSLSPASRSTSSRAAERIEHRSAARPAADVGGRVRLPRLRHGAPDGAPRPGQARPDRHPRGAARPSDGDGGVRIRCATRCRGDSGPSCAGVSARAAYEAAEARLDGVIAALEGPLDQLRRRSIQNSLPTRRPPTPASANFSPWSPRRKTNRRRATPSRSCFPSASPAASNCRRFRSIAR